MLTYGFFNSINGDRKYNAEQMAYIIDALVKDGVMQNYGEYFATKAGDGMSVYVEKGMAWFDSTWTRNDSQLILEVEQADVMYARFDAVVLEVDRSTGVRANSIKVVKGNVSSAPSKPTMLRSENVNQYPLAYIKVEPGVKEITSSAIEIRVGQSDCPWITGVLQTVPIDALFAAWNDEFNTWQADKQVEFTEWFDNLKEMLNDNVVTNLQNQINKLGERVGDVEEKVDLLFGESCMFTVVFNSPYGEIWGNSVQVVETGVNITTTEGTRAKFIVDPAVYKTVTVKSTTPFLDITIASDQATQTLTVEPSGNVTVTVECTPRTDWFSLGTRSNIRVSNICESADIWMCGSGGHGGMISIYAYNDTANIVAAAIGGGGGHSKQIRVTPKNGILGSSKTGAAVPGKLGNYGYKTSQAKQNRALNGDSGQTTSFTDANGVITEARGGEGGIAVVETNVATPKPSQVTFEQSGVSGGSGSGGVVFTYGILSSTQTGTTNGILPKAGKIGLLGESGGDAFTYQGTSYGLGGEGDSSSYPAPILTGDPFCSSGESVIGWGMYNGALARFASSSVPYSEDTGAPKVPSTIVYTYASSAELDSNYLSGIFSSGSRGSGSNGTIFNGYANPITTIDRGSSGSGLCYTRFIFQN